jgi:peptidoglycan/xylan/chitin deacetylase (PgdA/CDA1 family)
MRKVSFKIFPAFKRISRVYAKKGIKLSQAFLASIRHIEPIHFTNTIAVLMYHRINSYRHNELSVHPRDFVRQVRWLKENGFINMKMSEFESMNSGDSITGRRVIFTFDDGYEDNYTGAFPILKEYGYTAIFYLATEFIETNRMYPRDVYESNNIEENRIMKWNQIKLLIDEGMEVGSHSLTHPLLTHLTDDEARKEIVNSRLKLEEKFSIKITSFSIPGGAYFDRHIDMVRQAGYKSCCTTRYGFCQRQDNLYTLPRIAVLSSDVFFVFERKLSHQLDGWLTIVH